MNPSWYPLFIAIIVSLVCAYQRISLRSWTIFTGTSLFLVAYLAGSHWFATFVTAALFGLVAIPLNLLDFRRRHLTAPLLRIYEKIAPEISETEKIALEAGTVGWEGELFSGRPNWDRLLKQPAVQLSAEEQAFLDGPTEELCAMLNDWEITHQRVDLSPEIWTFLKVNKFFGMIIPKNYGGLGFSALAHSAVLQKVASISTTTSSTIAVPNSLGPAELLLHYGTDEQKNYYLPRLAAGEEIPCFALTGPYAGSDATSIPDYGIVCKGEWQGGNVLGVRITFDKRYITLAPIATVIGLAFRMYDPENLLGDKSDMGISLILLPRNTPGLDIGRRHFPLNIPFQNGPVRGKDIFVPLSYLIGGPDMVGHGWRMLVECLSIGRAITLPSTTSGSSRAAAIASGAYARIRKQFQMPIGRFEGVESALARIGGYSYAAMCLSRMTATAVDHGEKPAISSAIAKYHATELSRQVSADAMDIHGGKGIMLGPKNYLGRAWQGSPIAITVEGANILTRSLMIFGQGAIRCHPYVLQEIEAVREKNYEMRLRRFDDLLFRHIGFAVSNAVRSFFLGLEHSQFGLVPGDKYTKRFYRKLNRYSSVLALLADTSMLVLGGKLKQKENISARLGDILSQLYIASSMLKRYEDLGRPTGEQPLLAWAFHDAVFKIQTAIEGILRNFPVRPIAWVLRLLIFPIGRRENAPGDRLGRRVATLLLAPSEIRERLAEWIYQTPNANNPVGQLHAMLAQIIAAEPIERKLTKLVKNGELSELDPLAQLVQAEQLGLISSSEHQLLERTRAAVAEMIAVDDFDPEELSSRDL